MRAPSRPNILVITCHDLGRFLGCYGVSTVRTPAIDALAADGVRFSRSFCAAPQCSPSRAALFTGRYPHANGVMGLTHANFAWDLHPGEQHLAQTLSALGYATTLLGVHHESRFASAEEVAARIGMDEVVKGGRADELTERALASLERAAGSDGPFYLQVGYVEPHRLAAVERSEPDYMGFIGDYIEPDTEAGVGIPPYLRDTAGTREEVAELQGAVRHVDAAIGRLLAGLGRLGLEDHTLVLLTADHGVALPRAKCTLYDPGIEVALVVRHPARGWSGGRVLDGLVSNVDVLPTLYDLLEVPVGDHLQGRSLLPLLDGGAFEPRDCVFAELTYHDYYDPKRCIRTDDHKLVVHFAAAPAFMDPSQSWRPRALTTVPVDPARAYHPVVELFDLAGDPNEFDNLAASPDHTGVRAELLERLSRWMAATDDPLLHGAVTSPMHGRALAALAGEAVDVVSMGAANPETD
jgi:N-sulfoglucosamine sulfohydrolase